MTAPILRTALALYFLISSTFASAAEQCEKGSERLNANEPCIPVSLRNYLYCLTKSGGGRIEVQSKNDQSGDNSLEVKLNGKASGIILGATAGGSVRKNDITKVAKEVQERLDPTLAANCKFLSATNQGSVRPDNPPKPTQLSKFEQENAELRATNSWLSNRLEEAQLRIPAVSIQSILDPGKSAEECFAKLSVAFSALEIKIAQVGNGNVRSSKHDLSGSADSVAVTVLCSTYPTALIISTSSVGDKAQLLLSKILAQLAAI